MNKLDRIKTIKEELAKLEAEVTEESKNSNVRWRASEDGRYFYIRGFNDEIGYLFDLYDYDSNFTYKIGNYFKTEEEAEHTLEMLKVKQQLKDLALRLNKGRKINWEDESWDDDNLKYYICFDASLNRLELAQWNTFHLIDVGNIYCLNKNFLDVAKKEIGEDKLIELIKSGI